jgi:predicted HAD superfamily Cof-like phosphohydrolase
MVLEFHRVFGCSIGIGIGNPADRALRIGLIREELRELADACDAEDIIEVADALGDLDYVVNGAAIAFGIHLPSITREIHRSNMTKLMPDGTVLLRPDGKVLKGPNFELPRIKEVLDAHSAHLAQVEDVQAD